MHQISRFQDRETEVQRGAGFYPRPHSRGTVKARTHASWGSPFPTQGTPEVAGSSARGLGGSSSHVLSRCMYVSTRLCAHTHASSAIKFKTSSRFPGAGTGPSRGLTGMGCAQQKAQGPQSSQTPCPLPLKGLPQQDPGQGSPFIHLGCSRALQLQKRSRHVP